MKNQQSSRLALCGMATALSTLLMLLTVVPVSEIGLPAVAGLLLIPVVIEIDRRYALAAYTAVGLLSLLLVGSWESKLLFIGFFGYYPILKSLIERVGNRIVEWGSKLLLFNAAVLAVYWILISFLSLDTTEFTLGGRPIYIPLLLLGNAVFILYDIGLTRVISRYLAVFSPRLRRLFRF